jgi:uncharacterized protein
MVEPARAGDYDLAVQQGVAALIRRRQPVATLPKPLLRTADDSTQYYLDSLKRTIMAQNGMLADEDPLNTALPGEALTADYSLPDPGPPIGTLVVGLVALVFYLIVWYRTTRQTRLRWWLLFVPLVLVIGLLVPTLQDRLATFTFLALIYGLP